MSRPRRDQTTMACLMEGTFELPKEYIASSSRAMIDARLPRFLRWHLETQDRIFHHLRSIWADRPRVMVDIGCHAGHTRFKNLSDAMLFMHHYTRAGGLVLAVDAIEDYVFDLQQRLAAPRYAALPIASRVIHVAVTARDTPESVDFKAVRRDSRRVSHGVVPLGLTRWPSFALAWLQPADHVRISRPAALQLAHGVASCCGGVWCPWRRLERTHTDHYCRITRQRLGLSSSSLSLPSSSYGPATFNLSSIRARLRSDAPAYMVRATRLDTLWRSPPLNGRKVDFLKVDIDLSWREIGLDALIAERGFRVMVIECDYSWGGALRLELLGPFGRELAASHNVSHVDQLAWRARQHGYSTYVKVPCCALDRGQMFIERDWSARYHLLAAPWQPFAPTGTTVASMGSIQDLVVVEEGLGMPLAAAGAASCAEDITRCQRRRGRRRARGELNGRTMPRPRRERRVKHV